MFKLFSILTNLFLLLLYLGKRDILWFHIVIDNVDYSYTWLFSFLTWSSSLLTAEYSFGRVTFGFFLFWDLCTKSCELSWFVLGLFFFLFFWQGVVSEKNTLSQTFAFLSLCKILSLTENICKIYDNVLSLQLFLTAHFKPWSDQRWRLNLNIVHGTIRKNSNLCQIIFIFS